MLALYHAVIESYLALASKLRFHNYLDQIILSSVHPSVAHSGEAFVV